VKLVRRSLHWRLIAASALCIAAGLPMSAQAEPATPSLPQASDTAPTAGQQSDDVSIRPSQFHASDEQLADLRQRIAATKWPSEELVNDDT
jgi:hypothetical protein